MSAADQITTLLGTEGSLLDLAGIEREIAAMWRSATDRQALTITRACRSNLVVLADERLPEFIDEVTVRHPARLIVITPAEENGDPPPIHGQVSALCHLRPSGGRGLVCSERITIVVRRGEERRVPSVVRGLAVGGLPIDVLADPNGLDRLAESGLLEAADRVLVDSTAVPTSLWMRWTGISARAAVDPPAGVRFFDLAWLRLAPFRRAIARAIEQSPMRKSLHTIESVDIAHARRPTSALLLAGWLGYRLHWGWPRRSAAPNPEGQNVQVLDLPARGRRIRLRFGPASEAESIALVLRAPTTELRVGLDSSESAAMINRGAGRMALNRSRRPRGPGSFKGPERIELEPPRPERLVVGALEHAGRCDRDVEPVLARARGLAEALDRSSPAG